MSDLPNNLMGF